MSNESKNPKTEKNLVEFNYSLSPKDKEQKFNCKGSVVWFTGPPASGKSTIANELELMLFAQSFPVIVLDGDNIRKGFCSDLGFSMEDRTENIRRVSEVAKLIKNSGFIALCCFVSPLIDQRQNARNIIGDGFVECYIKTPLEKCLERDPKGFYKKAKDKQLKDFTGIDSSYEEPKDPEITILTEDNNPVESARTIYQFLQKNKIIGK